ncbi:Nucleic acid-binding protein [Entamoeba marina]
MNLSTIQSLHPHMQNVSLRIIVLQAYPPIHKQNYTLFQYLVADRTGSIVLSLKNITTPFEVSSIHILSNCHTVMFKNALILSTNTNSTTKLIGYQTLLFSETPNMSYLSWLPDANGALTRSVQDGNVPPQYRNNFIRSKR